MAGKGPTPDQYRCRRSAPARGDWKPSPEGGWQSELPTPPSGLLEPSNTTWQTWFKAWWAGQWTSGDLPGLRLVIRLYDRVSRGDVRRLGELRQLMDSYGITPKGQQDRRWQRPEPPRQPSRWQRDEAWPTAKERLRALVEPRDTRDVLRRERNRDIETESTGQRRTRSRDPRAVLRTRLAEESNDGA